MIQTAIWQDDDFLALPTDPKLVYFMLLTQPDVTTCGVLNLSKRYFANRSGLSGRRLGIAIRALGDAGFTWDDQDEEEIAIRSWVRHNVAGHSKMLTAARDQYRAIRSRMIRANLLEEYPDTFGDTALEVQRKARLRQKLSPGKRFKVLTRDGFKCRYCGRGPDSGAELHIDHIQPVSKGGTNNLDNLVAACADCNLSKGADEQKYPILENENTVNPKTTKGRGTRSEVSGSLDPQSSTDLEGEMDQDDWELSMLLRQMGEHREGQAHMELRAWRGRGVSDYDLRAVRAALEKAGGKVKHPRAYVVRAFEKRLAARGASAA